MRHTLERQERVCRQVRQRRIHTHRPVNKLIAVQLVQHKVTHTCLQRRTHSREELRNFHLHLASLALLHIHPTR